MSDYPEKVNPLLGIAHVNLNKKAVCPDCKDEYFGLEHGQTCPSCELKLRERKSREEKKTVKSGTVKGRILMDEYFGDYFSGWGDRLDKQVERWCKFCDVAGKKFLLELEKMDMWLSVHPQRVATMKKWEQFITNWLTND